MASICLFIWSLSLCGYLLGARYGALVFGVPFFVYPLTLLLALLLFLVNPINIGYRHARFWLLRTLGRIFASPFFPVFFRFLHCRSS